jgi:hypothetical protein
MRFDNQVFSFHSPKSADEAFALYFFYFNFTADSQAETAIFPNPTPSLPWRILPGVITQKLQGCRLTLRIVKHRIAMISKEHYKNK